MSNADFDTRNTSPGTRPTTAKAAENGRKHPSIGRPISSTPGNRPAGHAQHHHPPPPATAQNPRIYGRFTVSSARPAGPFKRAAPTRTGAIEPHDHLDGHPVADRADLGLSRRLITASVAARTCPRRRADAYDCRKNTLTSKRSTTSPPGPAGRERTERVSSGALGGLLLPRVVCATILCAAYPGVPCPRLFPGVDRDRKIPVMTEFETIGLEPVESLTITTLVDNVTDTLLLDEGPAIRAPIDSRAPRVPSLLIEGGQTLDALRAEHGFAALVTISQRGREHRVLFDTGISPDGLVENMRRLEVSPHDVEVIVLSHGHFDHTTGMDGLIRTLGKANVPVLIHPEFWSRRRLALPGREPLVLPTTSRSALEGAGFEIIEQQQPSFLLGGSLLVTGEVDRTSGFERGLAIHQACRDGEWQPDPLILDDQALIANVAGKGLVVLTACGHAGVVNTVRYARRLTGVARVHAIVGGFHLNGPLFEPIIAPTCDALAELDPDYLVPTHCTGWRAIHALAARFPDAYLQASVGTRFEFHSD